MCFAMMKQLVLTLHLLLCFLPRSEGFCIAAGRNPTFTGPPIVEQVTISLVRVSWGHNILHDRECADQFFVKFWPKNDPYHYIMTDVVPQEVNYIDIKVRPRVNYIFEAIAREEKGYIGVDYNRAPHVEFQTSRLASVIPASPPPPPEPSPSTDAQNEEVVRLDGLSLNTVDTEKPPPASPIYEEDGIRIFGLSIEIFVGIFVAACVVLIVCSGGVYKILRRRTGEHNLNVSTVEEDHEDNQEEPELKGELKPLSTSIND